MMLNMRGDEEPFKQIPFCIYRVSVSDYENNRGGYLVTVREAPYFLP